MLKTTSSAKSDWIRCPRCGDWVRVGESCGICRETTTVIRKIPLGKGELKREYKVITQEIEILPA